ncbi:polysaccharide deacetylase family protein [candidate division GN15 bacterium]|nr:polysaccharide deacetylase family protein [candidate division GN15 bacterium]
MAAAGADFGTHSHSHVALTGLDDTRLRQELHTSRALLEDTVGKTVDSLSYPFGRVDQRVIDAAAEAGYTRAYTMRFGHPDDPPLALGRAAVYGFDTPLSVVCKLRPGPMQAVERAKNWTANKLSGGTVLLNRLRGTNR